MAQTYKFGNGTWATKKGSTLAYNDEDNNFKPLPFSFERNSIATRVNKEGLIEVVGNDIPRIDFKDSTEGVLLLENSSTNLITYSEDFSQSAWTKSNATATLSNELSPMGILNSYDVVFTSGGYLLESVSTTKTIGSLETISIFSKSDIVGTFLKFGGGTANGTDVEKKENYGNGWFRYSVTRTFTEAETGNTQLIVSSDEVGLNVVLFGSQLESGNVSSYIPTNGSTVQRAAETCNGSGNSEVFNDSQGVVFADINIDANDGNFRFLSLSDGSSTNAVWIYYRSDANQINFRVIVGGVSSFDQIYTINDATLNTKLLLKYKENNFSAWVNGFEVLTDNSGITFSGNVLNELEFSRPDGVNNFYGKTKEIAYYDTILTDAELEYMTSYRSLNEMVTELNLNAL